MGQSAPRQLPPQRQTQSLGAVDELAENVTANELQDIAVAHTVAKQSKDVDAPDYGKAKDIEEAKTLLDELKKQIEAATQEITEQTTQMQTIWLTNMARDLMTRPLRNEGSVAM